MEVQILEDSKQFLRVLVSLPKRGLAKDKRLTVSKYQVAQELKNKNFEFDKILRGPNELNNWGEDNILLEGEFVFSKINKTKKAVASSTTKTSKRGNRRTKSVKPASKNITTPGTTEED